MGRRKRAGAMPQHDAEIVFPYLSCFKLAALEAIFQAVAVWETRPKRIETKKPLFENWRFTISVVFEK